MRMWLGHRFHQSHLRTLICSSLMLFAKNYTLGAVPWSRTFQRYSPVIQEGPTSKDQIVPCGHLKAAFIIHLLSHDSNEAQTVGLNSRPLTPPATTPLHTLAFTVWKELVSVPVLTAEGRIDQCLLSEENPVSFIRASLMMVQGSSNASPQ